MAKSTIEWTDYTWSPWLGCTKVSPACDHCYAESWAKRAGRPELWDGMRSRTSAVYWQQPLKWDREAAAAGVRRRVFPSLCDPFDNQANPRDRHACHCRTRRRVIPQIQEAIGRAMMEMCRS